MKFRSIILIFIIAITGFSCTSSYDLLLQSQDVDLKYKAAFEYFNKGKHRKAAEIFESLQILCNGTPQGDTVQFYQGLSNFEYGDLYTAESNFNKFIEVYPRSAFTAKAKYLRIICLYESTYRYQLDQMPTRKAVAAIVEYVYESPNSEYIEECEEMLDNLKNRLDKKAFESAKLYHTIEDYKAAVYSMRNVLKDNAENRYREDIKYYTTISAYAYAFNSIKHAQNDRYISFIDSYYDFVGEFADSKYRRELDDMFVRAQKRIDSKHDIPIEFKDLELQNVSKRSRLDSEVEDEKKLRKASQKLMKQEAKRLKAEEKEKKVKKKNQENKL